MSLYNLPNATSGMDSIMEDTAGAVPSFFPGLLFFLFMFILIGGSASQRRREGHSDIPMWSVIASIAVLLISLFLTIRTGIIQKEVLIIVVIVTILSGFWFFMSRGRGEAY